MSSLKLDEPVEKFKEFYGRNIDQMPKLLGEGRIPLSAAGLMQRRLEVLTASEEIMDAWWGNHFDTGDAIIYHPDGRFKVVTGNNAEPIWKEINPNCTFKNGALILSEGTYDLLDGESFSREEIGRYGITEKILPVEEAKRNPIWKTLAGKDPALLDAYVDATFKKAKEDFGYDSSLMERIGILSQLQDVTAGRLWCLNRLDECSNHCNSLFGNYLLINSGRFVGIAPETL